MYLQFRNKKANIELIYILSCSNSKRIKLKTRNVIVTLVRIFTNKIKQQE